MHDVENGTNVCSHFPLRSFNAWSLDSNDIAKAALVKQQLAGPNFIGHNARGINFDWIMSINNGY